MKKRLLSLVLTLAMLASLFAGMGVTASASDTGAIPVNETIGLSDDSRDRFYLENYDYDDFFENPNAHWRYVYMSAAEGDAYLETLKGATLGAAVAPSNSVKITENYIPYERYTGNHDRLVLLKVLNPYDASNPTYIVQSYAYFKLSDRIDSIKVAVNEAAIPDFVPGEALVQGNDYSAFGTFMMNVISFVEGENQHLWRERSYVMDLVAKVPGGDWAKVNPKDPIQAGYTYGVVVYARALAEQIGNSNVYYCAYLADRGAGVTVTCTNGDYNIVTADKELGDVTDTSVEYAFIVELLTTPGQGGGNTPPAGGGEGTVIDAVDIAFDWTGVDPDDPADAVTLSPDHFKDQIVYWLRLDDEEGTVELTYEEIFELPADTMIFAVAGGLLENGYTFANGDDLEITCDKYTPVDGIIDGSTIMLLFPIGTASDVLALFGDEPGEDAPSLDPTTEVWWGFGAAGIENFTNYTAAGTLADAFRAANANADTTNTVTYVKLNGSMEATTPTKVSQPWAEDIFVLNSGCAMVIDLVNKQNVLTINSTSNSITSAIICKGDLTLKNGTIHLIDTATSYNSFTGINAKNATALTISNCDITVTADNMGVTGISIPTEITATISGSNITVSSVSKDATGISTYGNVVLKLSDSSVSATTNDANKSAYGVMANGGETYLSGNTNIAGTTAGIYVDYNRGIKIHAKDGNNAFSGGNIVLDCYEGYIKKDQTIAVYDVTDSNKGKFKLTDALAEKFGLADSTNPAGNLIFGDPAPAGSDSVVLENLDIRIDYETTFGMLSGTTLPEFILEGDDANITADCNLMSDDKPELTFSAKWQSYAMNGSDYIFSDATSPAEAAVLTLTVTGNFTLSDEFRFTIGEREASGGIVIANVDGLEKLKDGELVFYIVYIPADGPDMPDGPVESDGLVVKLGEDWITRSGNTVTINVPNGEKYMLGIVNHADDEDSKYYRDYFNDFIGQQITTPDNWEHVHNDCTVGIYDGEIDGDYYGYVAIDKLLTSNGTPIVLNITEDQSIFLFHVSNTPFLTDSTGYKMYAILGVHAEAYIYDANAPIPHEHSYTYTANNNGTHNGACDCGEDAIENEACTYGNDEVCYVCGYDSHEHKYTYTSNNNGTHNGACVCGKDAITNEACTYGNDEVCDVCGYDSHEHKYTYTSNNNGTHNGACVCGKDAITNEACTYGNDEVCDVCGYDKHEHKYTYTSNNNGTHNGACACGENAIANEACTYVGGKCEKCGYSEPVTPPAPPTVNVPVSNNENTVDVEAEISGNDATIKPLDEEQINKLVGSENASGDVVIDLSKLDESIDTAGIPKATLEAIVKAAEDAGNKTEYLVIKLSTAELKLDDTAMRAIVDQANGDVIKFNFDDVGLDRLNATQKDAVKDMDVRKGYEAYITVNDQRIGDFKGGKVEIVVPYAVPEGENVASFSVWYVDDDGTLEKQQSTYDGKEKCFIVTHFSDYVIVYSAEEAPQTAGGSMWILWIILIILVCVTAYFIYKKRQARKNRA